VRLAPTTADPTVTRDQRQRCQTGWSNRSPATRTEWPSCIRTHGVRAAPINPTRARQTGRSAHTTTSQGNGAGQISRRKQPAGQPAHPPQQRSGLAQIGPKESARGLRHRRRNDTRRTSAAPCGQSKQGKQSHDSHKSCRVSNKGAAASRSSSPWTANRGAIVQLHDVSMMQCRRSPTGASTARKARLPRPPAGTRGCHPP